ncbi:MAG TPA: RNA 2',3'-cyclic phosphodiesterase [Dehalococcoidia bacterium]|nr:RNA 2',3'-cyclic phosphodiesterase [Dehalococcoidia bacterium]
MTTPDTPLRLFIALDLPDAWKHALEALQRDMQTAIDASLGPNIRPRWVRPEGIHLTLKFLGDTPAKRLDALTSALAQAVPAAPGFDLTLARVGAFEQRRVPRVILATIASEGRAFIDLYEHIETWLAAAGWPRETRTFRAHLTLARLPDTFDDTTRRAVAGLATTFEAPQAPAWHVERVYLIRSHLGPGGARYEQLAAFPNDALQARSPHI